MSLLEELNESQRTAVEYIDGPSLVIAGAGSGKTRVLTYKVAYLLEKGLQPWSILALTFTNKAANEMKERIGKLVGMERAHYLQMGTFHSVFSRILRAEAVNIGFSSTFTIYDESDSRSLLKTIVKEMGLDDKTYKPATVHSRISMAKNHLISPERYALDSEAKERDKGARIPEIWKIYNAYCQRCRKANAMDFDDLLVLTYQLFNEHDDIRRKYAEKFQYVLVDEYQDTNYAQQSIVLQLTCEHQHVCVVGDDYQSIYGFRGANIDNILDFKEIYKTSKLFKLEQNYRSTQKIVDAANSLMKHNNRQIPKEVFSKNAEGESIVYKPTYSDKEEAIVVCKDIKRLKQLENCDYNNFAILYRTNSQSRSFEDEMLRENIPYRVFGGLSFYQRKEIKDVIAYFRLVANVDDEEAFKRIVNYPSRGIGDTTLQKIAQAAQQFGVSFWQVISSPEHYTLNVNKGTLTKLDAFRILMEGFQQKLYTADAFQLGEEIVKLSGIHTDIYASQDTEDLSRQENLVELLSSLQSFVEDKREEGDENIFLTDYLQQVSLQTDLDSDDDKKEGNKVALMTIHSAKGLEFSTVFVVGLDENIFPSQMCMDNARELEEERRLLYVAITRAEKHCELTSAQNRYRYGKPEFFSPSRFIKDIDPRFIKKEDETYSRARTDNGIRGWNDDYRTNKPYIGSHEYDRDQPRFNGRMQNSRPVASQFMADVKPKATFPTGNFHRVSTTYHASSPVNVNSVSSNVSPSAGGLQEGNIIEHQRFGVGKVVKLEGTGENTKATVEFKNSGSKQLLLKFAKFKIVG